MELGTAGAGWTGNVTSTTDALRKQSEARRAKMKETAQRIMQQNQASQGALDYSGAGVSMGGGAQPLNGAWGNPDAPGFAQNYLTTIRLPNGKTATVHKNLAQSMQGLLTDLWNAGYKYTSVGGFNNRNIAGTNKKSLHAWGGAIDIDPMRNPYKKGSKGFTGSIPAQLGYQLAQKWGLRWGADFGDSMHFSVRNGPVPWN